MLSKPGESEKDEKDNMLQYQSLPAERNLGYLYKRGVLKIPYPYHPGKTKQDQTVSYCNVATRIPCRIYF